MDIQLWTVNHIECARWGKEALTVLVQGFTSDILMGYLQATLRTIRPVKMRVGSALCSRITDQRPLKFNWEAVGPFPDTGALLKGCGGKSGPK